MKAIIATRSDSQPQGVRTGGSTFANPDGHKSWQLIDQAGCRGLSYGGATISDKHCNFMINANNASASEIETLGEMVKERVKTTSGVDLRWEIRRIGIPDTSQKDGGQHD
jgi:UDP-N-acetylmuramate dehydrogenase